MCVQLLLPRIALNPQSAHTYSLIYTFSNIMILKETISEKLQKRDFSERQRHVCDEEY